MTHTLQKHKNALALMLLSVALISLVPTLTIADAQKLTGTIGIKATGQATPIGQGKGTPSLAMLVLNGTVQSEGNGELKINSITGFLQIGSVNYTIASGQGQVNNGGKSEINAKTNGGKGKNELVLHGTIQGSNVAFDSHESKLSSLFFLSLTGHVTITMNTYSSTSKSKSEVETEHQDEGNHSNQTVTETIFVTQNKTVFSTVNNNFTTTQNVTKQNNITVTVTKPVNTTITVTTTQTIANSTITKIVTTTVANTTFTTTLSSSTTGP